jgi:hypothetical protein
VWFSEAQSVSEHSFYSLSRPQILWAVTSSGAIRMKTDFPFYVPILGFILNTLLISECSENNL